MTISSETRRAGPFAGNGVATAFPFTFKVFSKADIAVSIADTAGVIRTLTLDSDYSVTLNADQNSNPGGTVTYPLIGNPLPGGWRLAMVGVLAQLQPTDITNNGGFYPQVIEDALDRAVILIQQLRELLGRQLTLGVTDIDGSGAYSANGNRISNLGAPQSDTDAATYGAARDIAESLVAGVVGGYGSFMQDGDGAVERTFQDKMRDSKTSKDWGAPGILTTDATKAITNALLKWRDTGCGLEILEGKHHISSPIIIEMDGVDGVGEILMRGSIVPDAGIGRAITIQNALGGTYTFRVRDGGRGADFTQSDPAGGDEAFALVNCTGGIVYAVAENYAGRMLRLTSDPSIGSGFETQWMDIRYIRTTSSASITAPEDERLAAGVGQAFYIDTGLGASGRIRHADMAWETYGSIVKHSTDFTIDHAETLYRGLTGLKLLGCISFNGGTLNLGSEKSGWADDLLYIADEGGTNPENINIKKLFVIGGYNGLRAVNAGISSGNGLSIAQFSSYRNTNEGIRLENCRNVTIKGQQYADNVGVHFVGACSGITTDINTRATKLQAGIVDSTVTGDIKFRGSAYDGNVNNAAGTSLFDIATTGYVSFDNFTASSGNVDVLYDLPAGNLTRITFGRVVVAGATTVIGANQPSRATGVIGWQTSAKGSITIPAGQTSVVVTHGLVKAPDYCDLEVASPGVFVRHNAPRNLRTATQFTIQIDTAQASDFSIDWKAEANYSG